MALCWYSDYIYSHVVAVFQLQGTLTKHSNDVVILAAGEKDTGSVLLCSVSDDAVVLWELHPPDYYCSGKE